MDNLPLKFRNNLFPLPGHVKRLDYCYFKYMYINPPSLRRVMSPIDREHQTTLIPSDIDRNRVACLKSCQQP